MLEFIGTRAQGLAAMHAFSPRMGRRYANGRNYDHGAGRHTAVSCLSPYIRRRLATEREVVAAALAHHGPAAAEKFIDEVIWRGYFKGWLERRPQVWAAYRDGLNADLATIENDRRLRRAIERAENGETGLEYFDAWAQELTDTGYLHNHARMWFASIWIFTLGLPWRVGADFFLRHLLDGDAASNTLGWRWVAGLHTRGKPYAAQASNIEAFTSGRFAPRADDLNEVTQGLEGSEPDGLPPLQPLRGFHEPQKGKPTMLLITDEDCRLEEHDLAGLDVRAATVLIATRLRSPRPVAERVAAFDDAALTDASLRIGLQAQRLTAGAPADLAARARRAGVTQIVTPYATRGPVHDWLTAAMPALASEGVVLAEWRREWDSAIWPHATAGFFKVKQQIPRILEQAGLS